MSLKKIEFVVSGVSTLTRNEIETSALGILDTAQEAVSNDLGGSVYKNDYFGSVFDVRDGSYFMIFSTVSQLELSTGGATVDISTGGGATSSGDEVFVIE